MIYGVVSLRRAKSTRPESAAQFQTPMRYMKVKWCKVDDTDTVVTSSTTASTTLESGAEVLKMVLVSYIT